MKQATNKPISAVLSLALLASVAFSGCSRPSEAPAAAAPQAQTVAADGSFRIGEYTAIALRDGGLEFPNDNSVLGVGKSPEAVAEVLGAANLPTDKVSLTITPLLVKAQDRVLLFDTGAGTNFGPTAGQLAQSLTEAQIDAATVTDIFISHFHGDHVGGLIDTEGALAFPNATIHIGAADWDVLQKLTAEIAPRVGLPQYEKLLAAITPKVAPFEPNAELVPGVVKAVEIRGHTPGHSGYLIGTGADSVLYIGDSMHHHVVSVQKPDWTIAFDHDAPTAQQSRIDLLTSSAEQGQRIYAVHFPFPSLGTFERRGDSFVWVPAN